MAEKDSTGGTDIAIMIGSDGRLKALVDFDYLFDLAKKAGESAPVGEVTAFLRSTMKEHAARMEAEDEDAIDIALAEAAMKEEALPLDVARKLINGESPIKVYRKYRGLTQDELAGKVGSKPAYISQIETGRHTPGLKLIGRIAEALDVTIDDLVD